MSVKSFYNSVAEKIEIFEENPKSPALYALIGSVFYVMVGIFVKKLHGIPPSQILFFRCIISMAINTCIIKVGKHDIYPKDKGIYKLLMMRCIFGGLAHVFYYQGISLLNLSDAQAIFLTSPIWTTILASVWLGEKLVPSIISSIIVSFIGIVMIVKPPFLLQFLGQSTDDSNFSSPYLIFGLIASIAFSFLESLSAVLIRSLSSAVKVTGVIQYVYFSGFTLNGILMVISGKFHSEIYSSDNIPIVFAISILNFLGQITYSRGLQIGKAQNVVPFTYSQLVMSFLVDILIFHKDLNYLSLLGSCLILFVLFTRIYLQIQTGLYTMQINGKEKVQVGQLKIMY